MFEVWNLATVNFLKINASLFPVIFHAILYSLVINKGRCCLHHDTSFYQQHPREKEIMKMKRLSIITLAKKISN